MQVSTETHERSVHVVSLAGRLDALEAGPLRELLATYATNGDHDLIVDLRQVEFVDSAGLASLVKAMKDARSNGGDLRLVRPIEADAQRVFALTRFDQVFVMADTSEALLADW